MRAVDVLKAPIWAAELATGAKSFCDNPIIGSRRLNEMGLHVKRIRLAEQMSDWRRGRLSHLISPEKRQEYAANGFVRHDAVLGDDELDALRQEVEGTAFHSWDMIQGNAVTRFIPLPPKVLKDLPHLRRFVTGDLFQNTLRYVGSTDGDPLIYLHVVMTNPKKGRPDPQTHFHSDTFHPTAKCWYFLYDVPMEEGPFTYVPGSHRLSPERLAWEREESIEAAISKNRLHARGSFRICESELKERGFADPVAFNVPGNTFVVADTHGFHARGRSERPSVRVGIYGSLRRNPFLPFTGLDPLTLPGLKGKQAEIFLKQQGVVANWKGKKPAQPYVGKLHLRDPSPLVK